MRIPRSATSFLIALEAVAMVIVLVLCIVHPWATKPKNDIGGNHTEIVEEETGVEQNTENQIGSVVGSETEMESEEESEVAFSAEVLAKVDAMNVEQKVAQLFVITPEALTGTTKVTLTGNTTKAAIEKYPVGGLVYSSINFQNKNQVKNMLNGVENHYMTKFGISPFLMISEQGGADSSPLAKAVNYAVASAPTEIGASGDAQNAVKAATDIATYLKEAGFNINMAPNVQIYSQSNAVSSTMVAETVSTFGEKGIATVMFTFSSDKVGASQDELLVYKAGIDAGCDCIMVSGVSKEMVTFLRSNMKYDGIVMSDSLSADQVVNAVQAGVDMMYCPENFKEAYQKVLDAANSGAISKEVLDTAVARILTCKASYE